MTDTTRRLGPKRIAADIQSFQALSTVKNYQPTRSEASLSHLQQTYQSMQHRRAEETLMEVQLKASRDRARAAEWAFHEAVLAMKQTVLGQFGPDSHEIQSVGYKKKSARRAPKSRSPRPPQQEREF